MSSSIDLRTLEIAAAVSESGSMSEVGRRFGLTQSAVSQAVRRVEGVLGTALLHRDRRPLAATNAGRVLAAHVRDLSQEVTRALDAARAAAARPERLDLRLGMVDSFAGTIGAYLVKELIEGAMALRLSAWSGLAFSHAEGLLNHAIDAAITSDPMEDLADMARHPIYREPFILLVPKGVGETVSGMGLEDVLARHRLIRHSARSHMGIQVERHLRRVGLEPPNVLEFDTSDALLAMVAIGIGVAITTPLCLLQGATYAGDVEVIPLPGPGFSRELLFVARRGEFDSLGPRIADVAQQLIRQHGLPKIYRFAPWLQEFFQNPTEF